MGKQKRKILLDKEMSAETYALHRKVVSIICEAKALIKLPYLKVRITNNHSNVLALAKMQGNEIWISEDAANYDLPTIVFHEILHAVFGAEHDESCSLMQSAPIHLETKQRHELFVKWANTLTKKSA